MGIDWWAFVGIVCLAYLVPGPDFAVVLREATRSRRAGLLAAAGAQAGLCVHLLVAVLGLSLLLARSPEALTAVRFVGAGYLVYLGLRILWSTRSGAPASPPATPGSRAAFAHGFLTNLLNPKAVLFFAAILPQFVVADAPVTPQIAALGAVDIVVGVLLWPLLVASGVRLGALLARPAVRRGWDRLTGGVFVGLGGVLAGTEV